MPSFPDKHPRVFMLRSAAVLLMLLLCSVAVLYVESEVFKNWRVQTFSVALAITLFAVAHVVSTLALYRGSSRQLISLLWIEAALLAWLFLTATRMEMMHVLAVFWVGRLPNACSFRTSALLTAVMIILSQAIGLVRGEEWETARMLVMVPAYGFVLCISWTAVSESLLRREANAANQALKMAQQQLEQGSRQNERLRIAREIHDVLGHQITAQILNLEVATHKAEGAALSHVEQSLALAKLMLGDLRNAVSDLRDSPSVDFGDALRSMLARIPELETRLELDEQPGISDPQLAETLLRCIQEAVTNTLRHANATSCHISLRTQGNELVLAISDNGACAQRVVPGNGLKGMLERVESLAGRLQWQNHNGSLLLQVWLPLQRRVLA